MSSTTTDMTRGPNAYRGHGLELWRLHLLALALSVAGCGGSAPSPTVRSAAGAGAAEVLAAPQARGPADSVGEVAPAIQQLVDRTRIEPQVLVPFELTPSPDAPARQVQVARLELPPRGQWRPPVGP